MDLDQDSKTSDKFSYNSHKTQRHSHKHRHIPSWTQKAIEALVEMKQSTAKKCLLESPKTERDRKDFYLEPGERENHHILVSIIVTINFCCLSQQSLKTLSVTGN